MSNIYIYFLVLVSTLFLSLPLSFTALAGKGGSETSHLMLMGGNEVGNGGDGVLCLSKQKEDLQLLDFYEAHLLRGWKVPEEAKSPVKVPDSGMGPGVEGTIKFHLKKLAKVDPKLSQQYLKRLSTFWEETQLLKNIKLTDIADSQHLALSSQCSIEQIAIRQDEILPGQKRFLISQDLWEKLPEIHKAGLILHELIYEHLRILGDPNSRKARYLTSWIFLADWDKVTVEGYKDLLRQLKVPIYP